jgi:DNA primase
MRGRYDREELLGRIDLRALLDELSGPAVAQGRTARWRCPAADHDDVHPSVTVTTDRRGVERWRCWSGGHAGTAIDAIQVACRVGQREAIDELARRGGMNSAQPRPRRIARALPPLEPVPLHPSVVRYVEACEQLLWKPVGRQVLDYLTNERGLDIDVLQANRVGADPGSSKLRRGGGLPKGGVAAVFPALAQDGDIVYVQSRYLHPGPDRSKYGNPAARLGDNPRHGWTQPTGPARAPVIVCEGFPDAYTANSAGYDAVAVLGAMNATPALAELLVPNLADRPVIVAFDGDASGRTASSALTKALAGRGIMVVDLPLPSGADLNSWVHAARQVPELGPLMPSPISVVAATPVPAVAGP